MATRKSIINASVAALLLCVGTASASDWKQIGPELYEGQGWVWKVTRACCGGYNYQKLYPSTKSKDFWDKALDALTEEESEAAKRAFLESRFPGKYSAQQYYGQTETGVSVLQQGVAPGLVQSGQTLYGLAALPIAQPIDATALIHEAQRLTDRTLGLAQTAQGGAQMLVEKAVEGNSKAAQIVASAQVAAAAIQAANPPTTEVKTYQRGPATPPQAEQPPAQPRADQGSQWRASQLINARQMAVVAKCSSCHGGEKPKADMVLSFQSIASMPADQKQEIGGEAKRRMKLPLTDKEHMPPGTMLDDNSQEAFLLLFAS